MCSRSERALKVLVFFTFLERLGFITAVDGAATLFQSIVKDSPREFEQSCLLAMVMIQEGLIDNSWGYGFQTWGNQSNLANHKLLFQRIISIAPVTGTKEWIGKDDSVLARDIELFRSWAKEVASSMQLLMQAALISVLLADDSRTELVPSQPDLASWLPAFELPATPMTSFANFCLQYPGTRKDFSNMIAEDTHLPHQVTQMNVAVDFWKEIYRCIRALDDDMDVPRNLMTGLREGDDWQQQRVALIL
jgi:hypothetical protein